MNPDLKLILVIVVTFSIAFATSLLFEFQFFHQIVRYALVTLLILIELYLGLLIFKSIYRIK